ncbi:MAG: PDZ domain-containing protein [Gemmatimonadales bacterium]
MTRKWLWTALTAALVLPALSAQESPRERRTPRPDARVFSFNLSGNRARIGVIVKTSANRETDRYGAKIDAVTPGGPADKAGLKSGDIITTFNATSLAAIATEDADDSGPGRKLIELVGELDPGDTVQVSYRRGTEVKSATLVTDSSEVSWSGPFPPGLRDRMRLPEAPGAFTMIEPDGFAFCFGDAWCDLDLVTLNADLGEYFGAREGVLVVKAPADSALPLKGGDVILSIGGRKPTSPAHAMRILRSYETGETVAIEIQRRQRRTTLSWAVPDMSERSWPRMRPKRHRNPERGQPSGRFTPVRAPTLGFRVVAV